MEVSIMQSSPADSSGTQQFSVM